jgi:predicted kinase
VRSRLIVLTGLPGAGKSAIAEPLGVELATPVFSKDWIEAPILKTELVPPEALGAIGYDLLTALARRQLMLGQSAILDSVASTASIRSAWRSLAREFDAEWLVIECICSDARLHRERVSGRSREIPDWPELGWADVERVSSYFEPWAEDRLILDSVEPVTRNLEKAIRYVRADRQLAERQID